MRIQEMRLCFDFPSPRLQTSIGPTPKHHETVVIFHIVNLSIPTECIKEAVKSTWTKSEWLAFQSSQLQQMQYCKKLSPDRQYDTLCITHYKTSINEGPPRKTRVSSKMKWHWLVWTETADIDMQLRNKNVQKVMLQMSSTCFAILHLIANEVCAENLHLKDTKPNATLHLLHCFWQLLWENIFSRIRI
jgi:hypothetical protein